MQDYLDNSYDMNVTDLDIAIERFNIDIKRIESEYLFESALFDLDSKYYSESEENVQEKKKNKFFEFILNMFTKLKNLIKDMGTAIRNVTKKETLDSETYFNSEIGRATLDYDIQQVHRDVEDQVRKSRKFVQFISKSTNIDDRKVEKFVDGLAHTVRKSAVPIAITGATFAAYKACDKKINNIYHEADKLEEDAKKCAGDLEKQRAVTKVLSGVFGMISTLATVSSIYGNVYAKQQDKAQRAAGDANKK